MCRSFHRVARVLQPCWSTGAATTLRGERATVCDRPQFRCGQKATVVICVLLENRGGNGVARGRTPG